MSVSGDQTAIVLRVKEDGALEPVLTLMGHSRSVKTVHVNPFDPCKSIVLLLFFGAWFMNLIFIFHFYKPFSTSIL